MNAALDLFLLGCGATALFVAAVLLFAVIRDLREDRNIQRAWDAEVVRVLYQLADEGARLLQAERRA